MQKKREQVSAINVNVDWRENCFDAIRLVAAYMVASVHWTKLGVQVNDSGLMQELRKFFLCFPCVVVFFVISGFLAAASRENSNCKKYLLSRLRRIYPALLISVFVNMIIMLVLYWNRIDWSYFIGCGIQAMGIAYTPSCMRQIPSGSMAGALWTVTVQLQFFVLIAFIYPKLKKMDKRAWGLLLTVLFLVNIGAGEITGGPIGRKILERTIFPYLIWFMFGTAAFIYKESVITWCKKVTPLFLCVFVIYLATGRVLNEWGYYADVAITVLVLPITIGLSFSFGKIRIEKDYSFSIFLYHWMVLNVFAYFDLFNKINIVAGFILYLVLVTAVSVGMQIVSERVLGMLHIERKKSA